MIVTGQGLDRNLPPPPTVKCGGATMQTSGQGSHMAISPYVLKQRHWDPQQQYHLKLVLALALNEHISYRKRSTVKGDLLY